jgi:hypothetical protein
MRTLKKKKEKEENGWEHENTGTGTKWIRTNRTGCDERKTRAGGLSTMRTTTGENKIKPE